MNTVLFLTQENKNEMADSIRLLASKQHDIVNGALVVCHQSCISEKEAKRIANPLSAKFRTGGLVKAASNVKMSHDGQIAVMFARFVALAYIRFPGPWLVIDEPTGVKVENWAKAVLDQHNLHGGKVVSLVKQDGKSLLSYGPVSIHLNIKTMKMLHFATNESWRSRGRYLLMNSGLRALAPELSPFCPISECSQPPTITPEKFEQLKADVIKLHTADARDVLSVGGENEDRRLLMDKIERATGKRPHHFTGIDKLKEMVQQLEQPASV
jgi:hypothetical protein